MQFLFDNDVPDDSCYLLRELGHTVTLLRHVLVSHSSDLQVLQYAILNAHILVTWLEVSRITASSSCFVGRVELLSARRCCV
jgi:hypothetical protein